MKVNYDFHDAKTLKSILDVNKIDKKSFWLTKELKTSPRTKFSNFFWNLFFKRFAWSRSLYNIDLEESKNNLKNMGKRIHVLNDKELSKKYADYILKFNSVFNKHAIDINTVINSESVSDEDETSDEDIPEEDINSVQKNQVDQLVAQKVKQSEDSKKDINEQLKEAISENNPSHALWLIKNRQAQYDPSNFNDPSLNEFKDWLMASINPKEISPKNLDFFALELGFGYKSSNLLLLEGLTKQINKSLNSCEVTVPPFLPISDFEMRMHIQKTFPDLDSLWCKFLDSFDQVKKDQFINSDSNSGERPNIQISSEGKKLIAEIQEKIIKCFSQNPYMSLQIDDWLKKETPELLIVRSTGKEDTENNSNAGGNDSIPFIKPTHLEISCTIGKVLASYFGEKSVSQRLLAHDVTLFTQKKPFLPVLLQVMVLENGSNLSNNKNPIEIPRSGVLFTHQKDKANGVTLIQTGLGNNEGIVSSKVDVDTYLINNKFQLHSVVREKKSRFVSARRNSKYETVEIQNNNKALERSQALPNHVLKDMKRTADTVSLYYSHDGKSAKSLDMEYTVKLNGSKTSSKPTIYLLQVRPLLDAEFKNDPSYIKGKDIDLVKENETLKVQVIIDIKNDVRVITHSDQSLFCDTLPQALNKYMASSNPKNILAIFVRKRAPATSHESVILRPKGVAVIVIENENEYNLAESLIASSTPKNPLLIDTQHGSLVSTASINNFEKLITKGLISYPIPRELSIPQSALFKNLESSKYSKIAIQDELNKAENSYQDVINHLLQNQKIPNENSLSIIQLFDLMATEETEEAKKALGLILKMLHKKLKTLLKNSKQSDAKYLILMMNLFQFALNQATKEIIPALYFTKPESMERLYPIKFLEAAIFQHSSSETICSDSFAKLLQFIKFQKVANLKLKDFAPGLANHKDALTISHLIGIGETDCLSQEAIKIWRKFIVNYFSNNNNQFNAESLLTKVESYKKMGVLSHFINIELMKNNSIKDINVQINFDTLSWISDSNKRLQKFKPEKTSVTLKTVNQFSDDLLSVITDLFGYNNNTVYQQLYVDSVKFMNLYNSEKSLSGKLALLTFFKNTVNFYDGMIKEVTGSQELATDRKLQAKIFAKMLKPYFYLMKISLLLVPFYEQDKLMKPLMGPTLSLDQYLQKLSQDGNYTFGMWVNGVSNQYSHRGFKTLAEDALNNSLQNPDQMFTARPFFSVGALVPGNKIDFNFSVHWPDSLEEYFTSFHQIQLGIVSYLTSQFGMSKELLSDQPKEFCAEIEESFKTHQFTPKISQISKDEGMATICYNIPLRQHAGQLTIKFDPLKPNLGIDISVKMMGNHEHNRWYQTAMIGAWLASSPSLKFTNNIATEIDWQASYEKVISVDFSIHIPEDYTRSKELIKILAFCMNTMTMSNHGTDGIIHHYLIPFTPLDQLDIEKFSHSTLYGNLEVIDLLNKNNMTNKMSQAIKYTLNRALKHSNLNLDLNKIVTLFKELLIKDKQKFIELGKHFLKETKINQYSILFDFLNSTKDLFLSIEDQWKLAFDKNEFSLMFELTTSNFNECISHENKFINTFNSLDKNEKTKIILSLKFDTAKSALDKLNNHFDESTHLLFKTILEGQELTIKERNDCKINLNTHILNLKNCLFNPNLDYKLNIVDECTKILIGAFQDNDLSSNDAPFQFDSFLIGMLGDQNYSYVHDNKYTDTRKIRKGIPLLLIKEMKKNGTVEQAKAFQSTEKLIKHFLNFDIKNENSHAVRVIVYALSKGYYLYCPNKDEAIKNLKEWWMNDETHLKHLNSEFNSGIYSIKYDLQIK